MNLTYATTDDLKIGADTETLEALAGAGEVTLQQLIDHTARLIRWVTRFAFYDTDERGAPTDPDQAQAMQTATIMHVQQLLVSGVAQDVLTGGLTAEPRLTSTSENGASLSFEHDSAEFALARLRSGQLLPMAEWVLRDAGLLGELPLIRM